MEKKKVLMSMLAAGAVFCAAGAADAKPATKTAAKPAAQTAVKPATKPAAKPADIWLALPEVVATINGKAVTRNDVKQFMISQMPDGKIPPMFTEALLKQMAPGIVKGYVEQQLLEKELAKSGIKVSAAAVTAELKGEVAKMPKEQREMLNKQFEMQNTTLDKKIQEMANNPQLQKQIAYKTFFDTKVLKNVKPVTPAEVKAFYEKNINQFKTEEQIVVSHILFKVDEKAKDKVQADKSAREKAKAALAKLKKKLAKFAELAKKESACPSKAEGGKLPPFVKGKGQMVKPFEDAAASLKKKGDLSEPVKTQFGYHIIQLEEIIPAGTVPFDKVKNNIESYLNGQRKQEAVMAYITKLLEANKVNYKVPMPKGM